MNEKQLYSLSARDTDVQGALRRLGGDEKLYIMLLEQFLEDETLARLDEALRARRWDDAFTAAHALKGLAGNMGFIPLMHSTGQLVIIIRGGRTREVDEGFLKVSSDYRDITDAIRKNFIEIQKGE